MRVDMRFTAYGTSFGLHADDGALLAAAEGRGRTLGWCGAAGGTADVTYVWRRRKRSGDGSRRCVELACDGAVLGRSDDMQVLLDLFEHHAKIQTAYRARDCLFVHAGMVAWRGRGILMPGPSGAGKTTLVRAWMRAGADCYSDEFALIDRDGRVRPYPLPLSIRGSGSRGPERKRIEELGGRTGTGRVPIDLIVVARYRCHARWRPRPLSAAEAVLALMGNTVAARRPPEHTMPILRRAVMGARPIASDRGEARAVVRRLLSELS